MDGVSDEAARSVAQFLDDVLDSEDDDDDSSWTLFAESAAINLVESGFVVVDSATSGSKLATNLATEVHALQSACLLASSPNAVMTHQRERSLLTKHGVFELQLQFEGAPVVAGEAATAARKLCPRLRTFASGPARQLALGLGTALGAQLFVDEVKAQFQEPGGSCFPAHFDTTSATRRVCTAILYLNHDWGPQDGGELCLFLAGRRPVTVAPLFDRLVLFSSTAALHRTLPTVTKHRACVSFWFAATSDNFKLRHPPICVPCFRDYSAAFSALEDDQHRLLVKLAFKDDYRASFHDAFHDSLPLRSALALDDESNARALASLPSAIRDILARLRLTSCTCGCTPAACASTTRPR